MTKNGVLYILVVMIITTIICSVIAEFDNVVRDKEKPWYPTVDDAFNQGACQNKCNQTYDRSLSKLSYNRRKRCIHRCRWLNECINLCKSLHRGNEKLFEKCINKDCKYST
ncbi:hypothetical protein PIB30_093284 [Stylosanthes scabra]|uniref:Uncharacterized protein n=1 Tax=Stylosanthes scabra TaxID=79078 RepID=A0ABU6ZTR4_9FABA|nr:hypothetical protein [Stylosanthes scabra]